MSELNVSFARLGKILKSNFLSSGLPALLSRSVAIDGFVSVVVAVGGFGCSPIQQVVCHYLGGFAG